MKPRHGQVAARDRAARHKRAASARRAANRTRPRTSESAPKCSFCGRRDDHVRLLQAGHVKPVAYICDVCVLLAVHGLVRKFTDEPFLPPSADADRLLSSDGADGQLHIESRGGQ